MKSGPEAIQNLSGAVFNKATGELRSTGWKDIKLKIWNTDEQISIPVMVSTRAADVKMFLAEMTLEDPAKIEIMTKCGPSLKRQRAGDEVSSNLIVKGLKTFGKKVQEYPHPFCVIGLGAMGLRQVIHNVRKKTDFVAFDRNDDLGGNAWHLIGNHSSKLQTEGVHYQLQYDIAYGGWSELCHIEEMGYWPNRGEIISHFNSVFDSYDCWQYCKLYTELTNMNIIPETRHFSERKYDMSWKSTRPGDDSTGIFRSSCITYYPGCLVVPHRKLWPGEENFGGQIGYGFGREFDFALVNGQDGIIIGQGAFSHENVRSFVENHGRKVYVIARHWNLMLPRMLSWWINQAIQPMGAAMVLEAMTPMYTLMGWDQWSWYSVTTNADRTLASIKQYTRWGISDILFLAVYWGKAEIFEAEVKRFKHRSVVLTNGKVLTDVDHVMKVIGFDGDFGVDRLMQTKENIGLWPNGDWRRFIISDNSAIDASRFNAMSIAPAVAMHSRVTEYFFQHPEMAYACLGSGMLPKNGADVEHGSPCYHYEPRVHITTFMTMGAYQGDLGTYDSMNTQFKKATMLVYLPIAKYVLACKEDWDHYCAMFKEQGWDKPWPKYPYTAEYVTEMLRLEEEEVGAEFAKRAEKKTQAQVQSIEMMLPSSGLSMEPARTVLRARNRNPEDTSTHSRQNWLNEGKGVKDWLIEHSKGRHAVEA